MNKSQYEHRRRAYNAWAAAINPKIKAVEGKNFRGDVEQLKSEVAAFLEEGEALDRAAKSFGGDAALASGGNAGRAPTVTTKAMTGAQVNPLAFPEGSLKRMHQAFLERTPLSIKAYSTVASLLPAQLDPNVVAHIHEWRIMDRLPTIAISAPSYEFIVHNAAGDSGAPTTVAEGGAKPEWTPAATKSVVTAQKLALNTGISYESLMDWPQWQGYVVGEAMRQLMDLENSQLLSGNGSGTNLTGFIQTSGILTHNCSLDPAGWTAIDSIEASITAMRVGTALAEPDLCILSPNTWAAIRRTKTTTNAYVVGDPLHEPVSTLWGVPVLITTSQSDGTGLLLDTKKFGSVLVRESISMHQGFSGSDFIDNVVRYVFEERIALADERPQAVLAISNLPTS